MKSEFKYPHELTESELTQLYAIHKRVYLGKGIGLEFDIWKDNLLNKTYHSVTNKLIQLFHFYDYDRIDAYNILLEPVKIEEELWSKIIEGGSTPLSLRDARPVFLDMYKDLLSWKQNIIFWGETGVKYHSITNLLIESNFDIHYDISKMDLVVRTFIQSNEFELCNGDYGVEIKRETFYTPFYHGYVLVNDYRYNLNI